MIVKLDADERDCRGEREQQRSGFQPADAGDADQSGLSRLPATWAARSEAVAVQGNYAYELSNAALRVLDISNPAQHQKLSEFVLPDSVFDGHGLTSTATGSTRPTAARLQNLRYLHAVSTGRAGRVPVAEGTRSAVTFQGHLAFVGNVMPPQSPDGNAAFQLEIDDLSDPEAPPTLSTYALRGRLAGIAVSGSKAYVSYDDPLFDKPAVEVVNISDLAHPAFVSRRAIDYYGTAGPIAVSGNLLAVSDSTYGSGIVQIIDASNPALLRVRGRLLCRIRRVAASICREPLSRSWARPDTSGYPSTDHQMFSVVDVSDPADPAEIGALDLGRHFGCHRTAGLMIATVGTQTFVAGRA